MIPDGLTFDFTTTAGRKAWRAATTGAVDESDDKADRAKRWHRAKVERLEYAGSQPPYGWRRNVRIENQKIVTWWTVDDEAADVIREIARRVRGGETVNVVCVDLNRRGVRSPRGVLWSISTVRAMLLNPRVAGYLAVKMPGKDVWQIKGQNTTFPLILTDDEWSETVAALRTVAKRNATGQRVKRLLAGYPRCADCKARLFHSGQGCGCIRRRPRPGNGRNSTAPVKCRSGTPTWNL